jgi:hypothetical protein
LPFSQVVDGMTQDFGTPQDVYLPLAHIVARVEGSIQNSTATPDSPNTAFYAKTVDFQHAAVTPPDVVEPPLPPPTTPITLPGIPEVFPYKNGDVKATAATKKKG